MVGDWTSLHDERPSKVCSHNSNSSEQGWSFQKSEAIVPSVREISSLKGWFPRSNTGHGLCELCRLTVFSTPPHASSTSAISGTLNCMWEGRRIILISCPYWVPVEVRLQIADKLTVNVTPSKPYKWAVLLAYTSHNLECFIVETKFAKDQAPDQEHLHQVKLSAIFAQVQTPVRIFLRRLLLAIVEATKSRRIHTEEVLLKQKHKLTTRGVWRAPR